MKTINALVKELARREGLKSQVAVGNVREIVGHLADLIQEESEQAEEGVRMSEIWTALRLSGIKRAKKRKRK